MNKHQEIRFEEAIEYFLTTDSGYKKGEPSEFDPQKALFKSDVIEFVKSNQPKLWESLKSLRGEQAEEELINFLAKELDLKGSLHILRHGFKCYGKLYKLVNFAPNSTMNEQALVDYEKNILKVYRQVHFSVKNPDLSLDVVLSINGLPVATMELKNPMTGQNVNHAKHQYRADRDPNEPIFIFKQRSLVHFAVDPDEVYMTTKLNGKSTYFLPFNKGSNNSAGNPPAEEGKYKTSYLWDEVLTKDSMLEILQKFMHLEKKEVKLENGKTIIKETVIFPRYHQLDVVRKLLVSAKKKGSGRNYLIQHSAGSGKSNSIAWLAHRLSSLHDEHDNKIFNSVIVITDRRVLDQQLQDTIYQFEHKDGVVEKIDKNTQQLVRALSNDTPIIITTIQKFPFITQAIRTMEKNNNGVKIDTDGKKFAVIVDEAHSSQSGETAAELRKILNKGGIDEAIAEQMLEMDDENLTEDAKRAMIEEMQKRPKQKNLSFFAFTATPKFKTIALFDEAGENGETPFHCYTMKQAIEEGFILDVLKSYTTYSSYYGIIKSTEDDPTLPKKKAAKALVRFINLHDYNISQKVEVIIEHFYHNTMHKIGGRAKAMVVTSSRQAAVKYKLAFDKYIKDKGYTNIKSLVAFSGSIEDDGTTYTEVGMNNGVSETELPEKFESAEYKVLLVAEKYQTGFDQPLLHTMYVDKKLSGIQAVQTLSRLNRTTAGKEDTFVLDFVNKPEDIYEAFKPYYEVTQAGEMPDPHKLYELQHTILEWQILMPSEITAFCNIWFSNKKEMGFVDHQKLNNILDQALSRYKNKLPEEQELFKGQLKAFRNIYAFLSQVIPYQDSDLEQLYTYVRYLMPKLRDDNTDFDFDIQDSVELKYYRLQKIGEGSISLEDGDAERLKGPSDVGTGKNNEENLLLSDLVDKINNLFGTDFTKADQIFFDQIEAAASDNSKIIEAAQVNNLDDFGYVFNKLLKNIFLDRMEDNEEVFNKVMGNDNIQKMVSNELMKKVYNKIRAGM